MTAEPKDDTLVGKPSPNPWRNRDFRSLMVGSTASNFGYQITLVAGPLVAVLTVHATSFQVGLIRMAGQLPYLLFVLFVGVVVDRWRRRNLLIAADMGRAVALAIIPVTFALHMLGIPTLYIVEFLAGLGTVIFDVTSMAYLPRLVERDEIARANSELESARSAALIGGPAIGGLFVSLFMPPRAVIVAVCFYVISVVSVARIRKSEPQPDVSGDDLGTIRKITDGLRFVARNPVLRAVAIITAAFNFCYASYQVMYLVFLPRELRLPGYAIGLALAAMGPGLLLGSFLSSWLPRRAGYGRVLLGCAFAGNLFLLAVPALVGPGVLTIVLLILVNFIFGLTRQTFTVALTAIRQAVTPDQVLGRVMATMRFLGVGVVPLGSLFGGFLGVQAGLRAGLLCMVLAMCVVPVPFYLFRTALTRLGRELPAQAEM
jgi:predicted MFS family arabinose efflux permease